MKYRYEFKNKALGEAVYTIFGEEFARDEIEQQMPDFDDYIRIEVDEWDANNKLFNSHIEFPKTEIERTLIYGEMLFTQYTAATYGPSPSDCTPGYWGIAPVIGVDLEVVAFRECPEPYRKL